MKIKGIQAFYLHDGLNFSTVLGVVIKCKQFSVQWDYIGKWDTRKKCKNYIEYICSVSVGLLGIKFEGL